MSGQSSSVRLITVLDQRPKHKRREADVPKQFTVKTSDVNDFAHFIRKKIKTEEFVITFPNRVPIDASNFKEVKNGTTLWLLCSEKQKLKGTVGTPITFPPHHHTITESGMYEYYDSRGIDSLVISLAELIDNSLSATKANGGLRYIEIRYYDYGSDSMVFILDNGHGMDLYGLRDWAQFKNSKFVRNKNPDSTAEHFDQSFEDSGNFSSADLPLIPNNSQSQSRIPNPNDRRPRYLDSEINYFGAGGKQAIFNIGSSTTMISKIARTKDVNELTLSEQKFNAKAKEDLESVYRDEVLTRTKGVERKIDRKSPNSETILNEVIAEMEENYKSFTICCIKNIFERHHSQFKKNIENTTYWTKGLARIYHYYLHGPKGNICGQQPPLPPDLKDMAISIKVFNVNRSSAGTVETTVKHIIDLKDIMDDYETLLVRSATDTFEFEVEHSDIKNGAIEGIIRYYPYLYDHETLPQLSVNEELGETSSQVSAQTENQIEEVLNSSTSKTKHREVFECFWHGRLIPQDCIDFDWTKYETSKFKKDNVKGYEECYNRLSGALFTNHAFKVSQNKQSFMDLNKLMAQKDRLTFYRVNEVGKRLTVRKNFELEFNHWLKQCHLKYDKQVLYKDFKGDVSRDTIPSLKKNSFTETYSVFETIEWRDKEWKKEETIQTKNTKPQGLIGRIHRFLVPKSSESSGNFMGSPGFVEIFQLPEDIYGKEGDASKIITFRQINTEATEEKIGEELDKLTNRLPKTVEITFPQGFAIKNGDTIIAGTPIGAMQVAIKNVSGDKLTTGTIPYKTSRKKLCIQTDIFRIQYDEQEVEDKDLEVAYDRAPFHSKQYDYWLIQKDEGIQKVGKYKIVCGCCVTSTSSDNKKDNDFYFPSDELMPTSAIIFTVVAAPPKHFSITTNQQLKSLIGKAFDLTLEFKDDFENPTKPDTSIGTPVLSINEKLKVTFSKLDILAGSAVIRHIVIIGHITENQNSILSVTFPAINETQKASVTLNKGIPSQIRLLSTKLEFINGEVPELGLLLFDCGNNEVTFDKQYSVFCRIHEADTSLAVTNDIQLIEYMHSGKRALVINKEIVVKGSEKPFNLRKFVIRFRMKTHPEVTLENELILKKNSKPSYIRFYFTNTLGENSEPIEIPNGEKREFPANSSLAGIHFKAFDCDDSPIDLNDFVNQTVNINWNDKLTNGTFLINAEGTLPNIHVHTNSKEERLITFLWKQMKKEINVEYSFYLRPYADSAQRMAINTDSHSRVFPVGVAVQQSIQLSLLDAYNNTIRSLDIMKRLIIRPITQKLIVDDKFLKKVVNPDPQHSISFVISNIKLIPNPSLTENDSVIGATKLEFSFQGLEGIVETIDINVVNGVPNCFKWLTPNKCLNVINNKRLEIRVQLCDAFNNPVIDSKHSVSLEMGDVFVQKELKSETDEEGVANFSEHIHMNRNKRPAYCVIPSELERGIQKCQSLCFGFHSIEAIFKNKQKQFKSSPKYLHMTCDKHNPVLINYIIHGSPNVVSMSPEMPTYTVRLFAEDKSAIYDFDPNKLEMHLTNLKDNALKTYLPIPPYGQTFKFRVDRAPLPSTYKVKFVCHGLHLIERSVIEHLNVVSDIPFKLSAKSQTLKNMRVVTNVGNNRQILESPLTLDLVDRNGIPIYENISNRELESNPLYSGTLLAKIINYRHDTDYRLPIPELEGCDQNLCVRFPIKKGKVVIKEEELKLQTNTNGVTNTPYMTELKAYFGNESLDRRYQILPFCIKIMFCDDTQRQQELNEIQNNISMNETQREDIYKELDDKNKEWKDQDKKYMRVRDRETALTKQLEVLNERSDLTDAQKIQNKLQEYERKLNELNAKQSDRTFRGQQIANAPDIEGVIGKIAHLAYVQDEGYARYVSWFLRNHMNCVVVKSGQLTDLLNQEHDIYSILSLDMISKNTPSFYERLPHQNHNLFRFVHTIGWIRTQLKLNDSLAEMNELKAIFTSLLSDTLFTIDINKAKEYRNLFERSFPQNRCPTIVTKEGILYENGIIEFVPKEDNFVCFQSPPDREYIRVLKLIDILNDLIPVHNQRVDEYKLMTQLKAEYERLKRERQPQLRELETTINTSRTKFSDISHTSLDLMDEDSNHSNHSSHRRSPEGHKRRRSYEPDRRSRSTSGESKRPRY